MAELVAIFRRHRRWEQIVFVAVAAPELLSLYNVLVGAWLYAHHQFPLMNVRGAALILGLLLLRLALLMYIARWQRPAFWMMVGLVALAELTGVVDVQDMLATLLFAFLTFPALRPWEKSHA